MGLSCIYSHKTRKFYSIPVYRKGSERSESLILGSRIEMDRYYGFPLHLLPWSHEGGGAWRGLCCACALVAGGRGRGAGTGQLQGHVAHPMSGLSNG